MQGMILNLEDGVTVLLAEARPPGHWYRAIIIHSTNPHYKVGGHDITVGPDSIEKARVIKLTDKHMEILTADAPVHGPIPTLDDLIARLTSQVGVSA